MNIRKALILGTGSAQLDAIRYLKENGWWVIACSYVREGLGLELVDHFELVNIMDVDRLEQLARSERVELVYSVGSNITMPSVAEVAARVGLPSFITADTARLMQSKTVLRDFLAERAISPVRYRRVKNEEELAGWGSLSDDGQTL